MVIQRTSVGLDVHARSVAGAAIDGETGEVSRRKLTPDRAEILAWVVSLAGPVRAVYEAGPTGFGLARFLLAAGVECVVAAPSKLQRPAGDRVKTDAREALYLARLLHLGEITPVTVPSVVQEAARDLVRAREDVRGDLMSARHRVSKLLLRQGIVYSGGKAWTGVHDSWLRHQRFGAYLGMTPTEHSSGQSRSQGGLTKTSNGHARRLLIEAAWHHRAPYRAPGADLRRRWEHAPAAAAARGHAGNRRGEPALARLHRREEDPGDRQRRDRPRAGRLVLVTGRP